MNTGISYEVMLEVLDRMTDADPAYRYTLPVQLGI